MPLLNAIDETTFLNDLYKTMLEFQMSSWTSFATVNIRRTAVMTSSSNKATAATDSISSSPGVFRSSWMPSSPGKTSWRPRLKPHPPRTTRNSKRPKTRPVTPSKEQNRIWMRRKKMRKNRRRKMRSWNLRCSCLLRRKTKSWTGHSSENT